jgi:hypothetical protein
VTEQPVDVDDAERVMSFGEDTTSTFLLVLDGITPHVPGQGWCVRLTIADGVECGVPSQTDVELLNYTGESVIVRDWDPGESTGKGDPYPVPLVDLIGVHVY